MITTIVNNSFINKNITYDTDLLNILIDSSYMFLNQVFEKETDIKIILNAQSKLDLEII